MSGISVPMWFVDQYIIILVSFCYLFTELVPHLKFSFKELYFIGKMNEEHG
jgi:hypothetical protein